MPANLIRITFIILVAILFAPGASSQVRRANSTPVSPVQPSELIRVYESDFVDVQPQFPGGDCEMINFINRNRQYPAEAYTNRIQGRVLCGFVIHPDGSITDVEVIRGVEASLNREAVRIIQQMPKWKAGRLDGQAVPVYFILPIPFRL